ncbi:MAG: hypothetical protein HY301_16915 [Verrucomicrobia bacterium]|nr:hypothetical protein [Verrucomicrobiota bacterium]
MKPTSEPCTEAKIVYEKPLSGVYDEILFGSASRNTLWVHFADSLGMVEWIGKFDCGSYGGNKVTKIAEPDEFFVCAGGWVYLVNATTRKLIEEPYRDEHVHDAIFEPMSGGVLTADWSSISLVKSGKTIWSVRIATDGIRDLQLEGRTLRGLGEFDYDGSERKFALDLETKKHRVGLRIVSNLAKGNAKPWWKFW